MSRILVSGSIAYDRIMNFAGLFKEHFVADKLHNLNISFQIESLAEHFGGTAGNIAYNLALLGEKPVILSNAGHDFSKYAAHLRACAIDDESIDIISDTLTSVAHIVTDRADNQIAAFYTGAGANSYKREAKIGAGDILIVGAGNIVDMQLLPTLAKKAGATFLFDPGQAIPALSSDQLRKGIECAEVLFANDYELALISQKTGWNESDIAGRVSTLIITLGKEGSRVMSGGEETRVKAVSAKEVRDPTGAGDAYRAGYIKGMILGENPSECAKLGSAVAVHAVEFIGTQTHHFSIAELKTRYEAAYGEPLRSFETKR